MSSLGKTALTKHTHTHTHTHLDLAVVHLVEEVLRARGPLEEVAALETPLEAEPSAVALEAPGPWPYGTLVTWAYNTDT